MAKSRKWLNAGLVALAVNGAALYSEVTLGSKSVENAASSESKGKKLDLTSPKSQLSYAIGSNIGEQLKSDFSADKIDVSILASALEDQLNHRESQLTTEQMVKVFQDLQKAKREEMEKKAVENKQIGDKYLSDNLKEKGTQKTESGLQYRVLKGSTSGVSPKETDKVKIHYAGTLIDKSEFDSSYKRGQPATFVVNELIPGWQEALQLMKTGEKWEITVPSDLAYGEAGRPPRIPPNSVLNFTLELQEIVKD